MDLRQVTIVLSAVYLILLPFLPYERIKNKYLREVIRALLMLLWVATTLKISNIW